MTMDGKLSRRQLIGAGATSIAGAALAGRAGAQQDTDAAYAPFEMGMQSYSLRGYKLDEALQKTKSIGLHYWEAFQAHIPLLTDPKQIKDMLAKLHSYGITLRGWGVQGFDANEENARKVFEFAKAMGVSIISADPSPEGLPVLDKLLNQYKGIFVAIHNHGPGARYSTIESVAGALKGHHERIGACVDTGHYLRSGIDPVEAVKAFGKRVYDVHLKDVKDKTQFVELGSGDLRTVDLLRELMHNHYRGFLALEYEEHEDNPMPYIDVCLASVRDAVKKAKAAGPAEHNEKPPKPMKPEKKKG